MKYTHLLLVLIALFFTSSCYQLNSSKGNSYTLQNPSPDELEALNNDSKNLKKLIIEMDDFENARTVSLDLSQLKSFENLENFQLTIKIESENTLKGLEFLLNSKKLKKFRISIDSLLYIENVDITNAMEIVQKLTSLESLQLGLDQSKWSNKLDVSKLTNLQEFHLYDMFKVEIDGLANLTGITKFLYQIGTSQAQFQHLWSPKFLYDLQYLTNLKSLKIFISDKAGINDFGFFKVFKNLPQLIDLELALYNIYYCDNIYPEGDRCSKQTDISNIDFLSNISYLSSLEKIFINLEENHSIQDWSPLEVGIFPLQNLLSLKIYAPYNRDSHLDTGINNVKQQFDKKYKGHLDEYSFYI